MFNLVPSVFLKRSFIVMVICCSACLWLLPISLILKFLASVFIVVASYFVYQQKLIKLEYYQLKQLDKKHWLLQSRLGDIFEGKLQGDSVINSLFSIVILREKSSRQTQKLLICKDMLPDMQYHRLQLQLRGLIMCQK